MTVNDLDKTKIPRHLAIIMDGNGRWAKAHSLPTRLKGHEAGAEAVRRALKACDIMGVRYLTLYTFSTENWKRPKAEVEGLMALLSRFLDANVEELREKEIRLRIMGEREPLPEALLQKLDKACEYTKPGQKLDLILALNYGSRLEIAKAAARIARKAAAGELDPDSLDEETFSRFLYLPDVPDPELMIRTGGEMRLSNFLLWQLSYSELYVTPKFWPDLETEDIIAAVAAYQKRDRRFGEVSLC
ncbi:isoprenyl transferase [bacterium]|nr:isoprenyl transferase [bacterium]